MKYTKHKPPHDKCEKEINISFRTGRRAVKLDETLTFYCGRPAKAERYYNDPKTKPMLLCGIHANQAKRRGFDVREIGETK